MEKEIVEQIKNTAKIKDVVEQFFTIQKSGRNLRCVCPFHDDNNPSMYVYEKSNNVKCYGCGVNYPPVEFLMQYKKMSYIQALQYLADMYGIDTQAPYRKPKKEFTENDRKLYRLKRTAEALTESFVKCLHQKEGANALSYLKENRHFTDDTIERFNLGFSSTCNFHHLAELREHEYHYTSQEVMNIGAARIGEDGKYYDMFTGKVVFPIQDVDGDVIGFAGRSLAQNPSVKYFNGPNTELYKKSDVLYGLYQAKDAIRKEGNVYIVEGYCDVISMHQKGIRNVVGTCGTAFCDKMAEQLQRIVPTVGGQKTATLMLDGDKAGRNATIAAGMNLLEYGFNVRYVDLSCGEGKVDPDSFCQSHTLEEVKQFIENNSVLFLLHFAKHLMQFTQADEKKKVLEQVFLLLKDL